MRVFPLSQVVVLHCSAILNKVFTLIIHRINYKCLTVTTCVGFIRFIIVSISDTKKFRFNII